MVGYEFPSPPVSVDLGFFDFPAAEKKRFLDLLAEGGAGLNDNLTTHDDILHFFRFNV